MQYVQRVSRLWPLARRYGFDAADRARGARERCSRSSFGRRLGDAPRTTLWFAVPAIARPGARRCSRAGASRSPRPRRLAARGGDLVRRRPARPFPTQRLRRRAGRRVPARQPARRACRRASASRSCSAARRSSSTTTRTHSAGELVFIPVLFAIGWLAGFALRERAEQAEAAEDRARAGRARARGGGADRGGRGARADRARAARHRRPRRQRDGAPGRRRPAQASRRRSPRTRDALEDVEQAGRTALAEMRRLLGAMRRDGDDVELAPQPGLDDLDSLLEEVGRAGLPVRLHVDGEPVAAPARRSTCPPTASSRRA